jgi:MerR family transcriptional regulator, thiopeptide resistance regulator
VNEYTIGHVARLSGVSVRTLHHYDDIGLLVPSGRSDAGYRLYSDTDLERLRQILFYRELGFGLEQIADVLASAEDGVDEHLRRQHGLLRERLARTHSLLQAIEHEMEARKMGISLTSEEQFEIFGTDKLDEQMKEAGERWGNTEAFKESQRRTAGYTKEDWITIKRQADENIRGFSEAIKAGEPADGAVAMDLAEAHRQHISRWFYACDARQHAMLAELYVSDARFSEPWDKIAPGFSQYVHDAMLANAARMT